MKILEKSKTILVDKIKNTQINDTEWKQEICLGVLTDELSEFFNENDEITFSKRYKDLNQFSDIQNKLLDFDNSIAKKDLQIQAQIIKLRVCDTLEKTESVEKILNELVDEKLEIIRERNNYKNNSNLKIFESLNVVITTENKTYKTKKDFEELDCDIIRSVFAFISGVLLKKSTNVPMM